MVVFFGIIIIIIDYYYISLEGKYAYSCTNPKSRDSRLELDNSRLTLDEKCLIRDEN